MSEVGFASGSLSPTIYFENASGELIMPAFETGRPEQARMAYELRYASHGWQWKEARTWSEVTRLQNRLIAQEQKRIDQMILADSERLRLSREITERAWDVKLASGSCSEFEKDFIRLVRKLRDNKKFTKYAQVLQQHQSYLWSVEMDSGTKIEDRMKSEPGDFWRQT